MNNEKTVQQLKEKSTHQEMCPPESVKNLFRCRQDEDELVGAETVSSVRCGVFGGSVVGSGVA